MRRIEQGIKSTVNKLNVFIRAIETYSESTLGRINDALHKIMGVAIGDIEVLQRIFGKYKEIFDLLFEKKFKQVLHFLDSAEYTLNYLTMRLDSDPRSQSLYPTDHVDRGVMDYGWGAFIHARGVFDVLWLSLLSMGPIRTMVPVKRLDPAITMALPDSLWRDTDREDTCYTHFQDEAQKYKVLVTLINDALRNWQELNDTIGASAGWPDTLKTNISERQSNVGLLRACTREYKDVVTLAVDGISVVISAIRNALTADASFDYKTFRESIHEDIAAINKSALWLDNQLEMYRAFNVSKIGLAGMLLKGDERAEVRHRMDSLLFKTDLDAIFKLQGETQIVKNKIQEWLVSGLEISHSLVPFFDVGVIDAKMRKLSFWRKPVVDLRIPELFKYSFRPDETWRTWPVGVPIVNLTTPDGSHYISDILDSYMTGINDALFVVQHTELTTKEQAMAAFDALWVELQTYMRTSEIDEMFIR